MIEMRWAKRMPRNPRTGPVTVLEYRVLHSYLDSDDYPVKEWSKWQRVPTVIVPRSPSAAPHEPLSTKEK